MKTPSGFLQLKGLDLRTNIQQRSSQTARDLSNVRKDSEGNIIKREAFEQLILPRTTVVADFGTALPDTAEVLDIIAVTNEPGVLLILTKLPITTFTMPNPFGTPDFINKFYRYTIATATVEEIPYGSSRTDYDPTEIGYHSIGMVTFDTRVQSVELENVLYFTAKDNSNTFQANPIGITGWTPEFLGDPLLMKYDGKCITNAGVAYDTTSMISVADGGTTPVGERYVRQVMYNIDATGNIRLGDYVTKKYTLAGNIINPINIGQFDAGRLNNFFRADAEFTYTGPGTVVNYTSTQGEPQPGQFVLYRHIDFGGNVCTIRFDVATVDVGAGTLTLGKIYLYVLGEGWSEDVPYYTGFVGQWITIPINAYLGTALVAYYYSQEYTFAFKFGGVALNWETTAANKNFDITAPTDPIDLPFTEDFVDFYDDSTVKSQPPRIKMLAEKSGALLLGDDQFIYYSDISRGGSIEVFGPLDNIKIGSTKKGIQTGIFANETYIAAFREIESYYVSGNIFTGNYRTQEYNSTDIGCSAPTSVSDAMGYCVFASSKGIHLAQQASSIKEVSEAIEPMFTDDTLGYDLDMANCVTLVDYKREYAYFSIPSKSDPTNSVMLAFSMYWKEWYLYNDMNISGGTTLLPIDILTKKLVFSDGVDIYLENSDESTGPFTAQYLSNFYSGENPSVTKRFFKVKYHTLGMDPSDFTFTSYKDFDGINPLQEEEYALEDSENFKSINLDTDRVFSHSVGITAGNNQPLKLNGFDYEWETDQLEIKK